MMPTRILDGKVEEMENICLSHSFLCIALSGISLRAKETKRAFAQNSLDKENWARDKKVKNTLKQTEESPKH